MIIGTPEDMIEALRITHISRLEPVVENPCPFVTIPPARKATVRFQMRDDRVQKAKVSRCC